MSLDTNDKDKDFGAVWHTDLTKVYCHRWCRLANNNSTFRILLETRCRITLTAIVIENYNNRK